MTDTNQDRPNWMELSSALGGSVIESVEYVNQYYQLLLKDGRRLSLVCRAFVYDGDGCEVPEGLGAAQIPGSMIDGMTWDSPEIVNISLSSGWLIELRIRENAGGGLDSIILSNSLGGAQIIMQGWGEFHMFGPPPADAEFP